MSYFDSRIAELEATKPAAAESFYNQSFIDRMNEAQAQIDGRYQEMNAAEIQKQESQDAYNTFKGEMRHYSELSKEAENKFGVATAKNDYEESKRAIETIQQTLDALPSTINATSERVLTQHQFELSYNAQADKWAARMNVQGNITDVNKKVWDEARRNADALASLGIAQQQDMAEKLAAMWNADINLFNTYQQRWKDATEKKLKIEEEYRTWQHAQAEEAYNRWATELYELRKARYQDQILAYNQQVANLYDAASNRTPSAGYQQALARRANYQKQLAETSGLGYVSSGSSGANGKGYSGGGGGGGVGGGW